MQITGVVEKVWANQTKAGTTYAYVIDNIRYGSYTTKLPISEGDNVSFDATQKGDFWNINTKTVKKLAAPANAPASEGKQWGGSKRDSNVQDSITFQSARKDALQLLDILASKDIIDFGKASKAKAFETALVYVDKLTARFFEDTKQLGHVEPEKAEAEEAPAVAKPKAKPTPAPVEDAEFQDDDLDEVMF